MARPETKAILPSAARQGVGRPRAAEALFGPTLLRITAGGFLLPHGLGKLFGWFGGPGIDGFAAELVHFGLPSAAPIPLLLAVFQTLLGLAVAVGAFTRLSASCAAAMLLVTAFLSARGGWFWVNHGIEYPLFWFVALVVVVINGPGRASADSLLFGRLR